MQRNGKRRSRATLPLLPSLAPEVPPLIQLRTGKVVRAEWRDPDDLDPKRRVARTIQGYRAHCPLRRCIAKFGERSGISPEHLDAADRLRACYDGARIGFAGLRDWRPVGSLHYGPLAGPTKSALRQFRCRIMFDRIWSLFEPPSRVLLLMVVLKNIPLARFVELTDVSYNLTKELLLGALDRLVEWFDVQPVRGAA
jgi:hypothetical protein